ncbi:hypothetical protein OAF80_00340 [bacterium]|nr:hypothetical protein [bacterium]
MISNSKNISRLILILLVFWGYSCSKINCREKNSRKKKDINQEIGSAHVISQHNNEHLSASTYLIPNGDGKIDNMIMFSSEEITVTRFSVYDTCDNIIYENKDVSAIHSSTIVWSNQDASEIRRGHYRYEIDITWQDWGWNKEKD